ncbi:unnamed protein product [Caenorhabditis auriculariae]|uniref:Ubiquitin-like protease family profile domain-containing protein n=1 Tax=Caenorhabditis auriculariae TaxID=2777116 RepID=A0A8S1HHQ1_9PELO|nr:unnamed protein product [Caenorhabditis auriculariae]
MVETIVQALYLEVSWEYTMFETFNIFVAALGIVLSRKSKDFVVTHARFLMILCTPLWILRAIKAFRGVPEYEDVLEESSVDLLFTNVVDPLTQIEVTLHYCFLMFHAISLVILEFFLMRAVRERRILRTWSHYLTALLLSLSSGTIYSNFNKMFWGVPAYVYAAALNTFCLCIFLGVFLMTFTLRKEEITCAENSESCIVNAKYRVFCSILPILISSIGPAFLSASLLLNVFAPTVPEAAPGLAENRKVLYEHMHLWTGFTIHPYFAFFALYIMHPTFRSAFLPCFERSKGTRMLYQGTRRSATGCVPVCGPQGHKFDPRPIQRIDMIDSEGLLRKKILERDQALKNIGSAESSFFLGNVELKLKCVHPTLDFFFNKKSKFSIRFVVAQMHHLGSFERDFEIAMLQLESITLKKGTYPTDPPAIVCHLLDGCAQKVLANLGDVERTLKNRVGDRPVQADHAMRQLIFILEPFQDVVSSAGDTRIFENLQTFMKVTRNEEILETRNFEGCCSLICNEILDEWMKDMQSRSQLQRASSFTNRTSNFFEIIPEADWAFYTFDLGLKLVREDKLFKYYHFDVSNMVKTLRPTPSKQGPIFPMRHRFIQKTEEPPPIAPPQNGNSVRRALDAVSLENKEEDVPAQPSNSATEETPPPKKPRLSATFVRKSVSKRKKPELISLSDDETNQNPPENEEMEESTRREYEKEDDVSEDETLLVFPPLQCRDKVTIYMSNLRALAEGELLNDAVIEFYLLYIKYYLMDEALRNRVHFFNSFLISTLATGIPPLSLSVSSNPTTLARKKLHVMPNYERVKNWTKKVDIFSKDYLVIPINDECHWLVIIVVNPGGCLVPVNDKPKSGEIGTYIVYFDSLPDFCGRRMRHLKTFVEFYLEFEFENKKKSGRFASEVALRFAPERIFTFRPRNVPLQKNFIDCGVYALYFVELFFRDNKLIPFEELNHFDWEEKFVAARDLQRFMRDKVFLKMMGFTSCKGRSRLERFEKAQGGGPTLEGNRKHRRHSVGSGDGPDKSLRLRRSYSVSGFEIFEDFNPAEFAGWAITKKARELGDTIVHFHF